MYAAIVWQSITSGLPQRTNGGVLGRIGVCSMSCRQGLRRAAVVGALYLLFGLLSGAAPADAGVFNPKTYMLANGMQVVVVEDHRAPVIEHMVWYRVGAADDPPGKSGIAHFLEHLMFKGTAAHPAGEFSRIVARNGGRENAFTTHDYTGYYQEVAADKLEPLMQLEADRMANLALLDHDVETERLVILEERRARIDNDPAALFNEQVEAAQYLADHYGIPVIGWKHEMEGLTHADAIAFYRAHYAPNNAILIVAGDVTGEQVHELAQKYYGAVPARTIEPRHRVKEPPQLAARRVSMSDPRIREASWSRSYLAPSRSAGETKHAYPLVVLAEVLGGGATSRLYRALVVDNGVATSAGAWYQSIGLDSGQFGLYGRPKPGGSVEAVEAGVDKVLADVLAKGITEAELAQAKTGLTASSIYLRDSLSSSAQTLGRALTSGLTVEQVEAWPENIPAVTIEQVNDAARYVLELSQSVTGTLLPKPAS